LVHPSFLLPGSLGLLLRPGVVGFMLALSMVLRSGHGYVSPTSPCLGCCRRALVSFFLPTLFSLLCSLVHLLTDLGDARVRVSIRFVLRSFELILMFYLYPYYLIL
jgi:hypothetical protein